MGKQEIPFRIIHPHAAGIDVGSRSHMVAVDQVRENVREFGVCTKDHERLISHLQACGVTTIAMESTGSYWQTLFNALQQAGFEVLLVPGSQTKNVKGRKTDVLDCQWIQKLHSLSPAVGQPAAQRHFSATAHLLLSSTAFGGAVRPLQQQNAEVPAPDEYPAGCGAQ